MTRTRDCDSRAKIAGTVIGAAALLLMAAPMNIAAAQEEVFSAVNAVAVTGGPLGSFDISFVDPVLGKYFLGDRSNKDVDVFRVGTTAPTDAPLGAGAFVGFTGSNDTSGPNGVITANNHSEVWAGDGNSTIKVINIATNTVTHVISTGGSARADELCVDPQDHVVLMANDADTPPFVTFISTSTYTVLSKISFGGTDPNGAFIKATNGIEQCQWSSINDRFYLNIPEVNGPGDDSAPGAVLRINPVTRKVEAVYNVNHNLCAGPQGMALGPGSQIALGCAGVGNAPYSVAPGSEVINALTGATIFNLPGLNGNDETWYTPSINSYFFAGSNHTVIGQTVTSPILGVVDARTGEEDQSVTGAAGSHSVAGYQNTVYFPVNNSSAAQKKNLCAPFGVPNANGCILILQSNASEAD
jgi:hypothetical protein